MVTSPVQQVSFHYLEQFPFRHRNLLKKFLVSMFKKEGKALASLQYIFCSDKYLLDINRQYLQHDFYTDIITFDLSDKANKVSGEIYISIDRVKDNARTFQVPFSHEILRVIIHGVLHLCGYKDKTEKEQKAMRAAEDKYLQKYLTYIKQ